jgi:DNA polymerase III sliding clamp (beta) subunit (PCNA family)
LDVLNIIDTEKITMELKEELSSGLIRPVDGVIGEKFLYVIMPMRL